MSRERSIREDRLLLYLHGLYQGKRTREWYDEFAEDLAAADPWRVNDAIDELISRYDDYAAIEQSVARFIRAATKGLEVYEYAHFPEHSLLHLLQEENRLLSGLRSRTSRDYRAFHKDRGLRDALLRDLKDLLEIGSHYQKIQYILFPALETSYERFRCVKLMWWIQDRVIASIKELIGMLEGKGPYEPGAFDTLFGTMYGSMGALQYREGHILFPVAARAIPEGRAAQMAQQSAEFPSAFGAPSIDPDLCSSTESGLPTGQIPLSVGSLTPEELDLMLTSLPFDMTYVDDKDRVRYYSQGKERLFPRSPGIIGREVQNCHPPDSVHVVQRIVQECRSGKRTSASFYLKMGDKFVHITYIALWKDGDYRGILEVSQDIAPLRALEGEKRLLAD